MIRRCVLGSIAAVAAIAGCNEISGLEVHRLEYTASHPIAISADGTQLVAGTGSQLHRIGLAKVRPGGEVPGQHSSTTHFRLEISSVAISPDGRQIAAAGYRTIHVSGGTIPAPGGGTQTGGTIVDLYPQGMIWSVDFSPDSKLFASSMGVYDTAHWKLVARLAPDEPAPGSPAALAAAEAAKRGQPDSSSSPGGGPAPEASAAVSAEPSAAPAPDGSATADAGVQAAPPAKAEPAKAEPAKAEPKPLFRSSDAVRLVRFHQSGKALIAAGAGKVVWLDTDGWKPTISTFSGSPLAHSIALCSDGAVALDAGQQLELHHVDSSGLKKAATFTFAEKIDAAAFSPDCSKLALVGRFKLVVYDVASGQRVLEREVVGSHGRQAPVVSLAWAPDGRGVFGGRADNSIERFPTSRK